MKGIKIGKYIYVNKISELIIGIYSIKDNFQLGEIYFFKHWKKWVLSPFKAVVFDEECLKDIAKFLKDLDDSKQPMWK